MSQNQIKFIPPKIEIDCGVRLSPKEFDYFRKLIEQRAGINLNDHKVTLVQARLAKRLRELGMRNYKEYISFLQKDSSGEEMTLFVNALTTNKTEFFRENQHFSYLKKHCETHFKRSRIYVWSAACSNGSEVYTLAMLFEEIKENLPYFDYRILGSDIDSNMLNYAAAGVYSKSEIISVPPIFTSKYFLKQSGLRSEQYRITSLIQEKVKFRYFNLVEEESSFDFKFDIIFLRNVLIYFAPETIEKVIKTMAKKIKPDGLLFIGHSENISTTSAGFKAIAPSVYHYQAHK